MADDIIRIRRDSLANWTTVNPVLSVGEISYDTTSEELRIGDGTTAWLSLPAVGAGGGGGGGGPSSTEAPKTASYIVRTADGTLTNETILGDLATGLLKNTTTTGVLSIATGTDLPSHNHAASAITSGIINYARLGYGTPTAAMFLNGDQEWSLVGQSNIDVAEPVTPTDVTTKNYVDQAVGLGYETVLGLINEPAGIAGLDPDGWIEADVIPSDSITMDNLNYSFRHLNNNRDIQRTLYTDGTGLGEFVWSTGTAANNPGTATYVSENDYTYIQTAYNTVGCVGRIRHVDESWGFLDSDMTLRDGNKDFTVTVKYDGGANNSTLAFVGFSGNHNAFSQNLCCFDSFGTANWWMRITEGYTSTPSDRGIVGNYENVLYYVDTGVPVNDWATLKIVVNETGAYFYKLTKTVGSYLGSSDDYTIVNLGYYEWLAPELDGQLYCGAELRIRNLGSSPKPSQKLYIKEMIFRDNIAHSQFAPIAHTHTLADLTQSAAADGQVITWNNTALAWQPATPSGGGGGATTLDGLTDVTITAPVVGDTMYYSPIAPAGWTNQSRTNYMSGFTLTYPSLVCPPAQVGSSRLLWWNDDMGVTRTITPSGTGIATLTLDTTANTMVVNVPASHAHALSDLTTTGTASATNFLRGDGAWTTGILVSDSDKGDISVTGSGTAWTIDTGAVTYTKLATDSVRNIKIQNGAVTLDKLVQLPSLTFPMGNLLENANAGGEFSSTFFDVGSAAIQIITPKDAALTYAKMQNVSATDKLLGRSTAGAGVVEEIACTAAGRALLDDVDASAQRTTLGLGAMATQALTSTDGSVAISAAGSNTDLSVTVAGSTTNVLCQVRNTTGSTLTKGTAVYISGVTGQISNVTKAIANSDPASAQTLGLMSADLANNTNGYVTVIGLIANIDTSAFTDGEQLYLSPATPGALTATKPVAPNHMVYVAVVEHAHLTQGKLFVKVQNGYELDEIHDVLITTPAAGHLLSRNTGNTLWENKFLTDASIAINTISGTKLASGTVDLAKLNTTGTASSGNFLRGDGAWTAQTVYAPTTASYIVQTADGALSGEQVLASLGTGILKNTTSTGILSIAAGTDLPSHVHAGTDITTGTIGTARLGSGTASASTYLRGDNSWTTVSAAPAGSTTQVQYNNSGAAAGATNIVVDSNNLRLLDTSITSATAAGGATLFSKKLGLFHMPSWNDERGVWRNAQICVGRNRVGSWVGNNNVATAPVASGVPIATASGGTLTARNMAATSVLTSTRKVGIVSAATAAAITGWRTTNALGVFSNTARVGGGQVICRFAISDAALVTGARTFIGINYASSNYAAGTEVDTLLNQVGFAQLTSAPNPGNLYILSNDGTGTATKTDTGYAINTTDLLEATFQWIPGSSTLFGYRLDNLTTGNNIVDGTLTTDLPVNNALLYFHMWRTNGSTAAAVGLDMAQVYFETYQ